MSFLGFLLYSDAKAFGWLGQLAFCAELQVSGSGIQLVGSGKVPGAQGRHGFCSTGVPDWSQHPLPHQLHQGYCSMGTACLSASAMNPESLFCFVRDALCG